MLVVPSLADFSNDTYAPVSMMEEACPLLVGLVKLAADLRP